MKNLSRAEMKQISGGQVYSGIEEADGGAVCGGTCSGTFNGKEHTGKCIASGIYCVCDNVLAGTCKL